MTRKSLLLAILAIESALLLFRLGTEVTIAEQAPVYSSLRETASIVFAVMGIWIAVLFPDSLERLYKTSETRSQENIDDFSTAKKMIKPMIYSTAVILFSLIFDLLNPVLKKFTILNEYAPILRGISWVILIFLGGLMMWTLIMTLVPAELLLSKMKRFEGRKNALKRFFGSVDIRKGSDE